VKEFKCYYCGKLSYSAAAIDQQKDPYCECEEKPLKVFISGPMTGIKDFNRPLFHKAAESIIATGNIPLNPAMLPDGLEHEEYLKICKAMIDISDTVYFLPGFEKSTGAMEEYNYARKNNINCFTLTL